MNNAVKSNRTLYCSATVGHPQKNCTSVETLQQCSNILLQQPSKFTIFVIAINVKSYSVLHCFQIYKEKNVHLPAKHTVRVVNCVTAKYPEDSACACIYNGSKMASCVPSTS